MGTGVGGAVLVCVFLRIAYCPFNSQMGVVDMSMPERWGVLQFVSSGGLTSTKSRSRRLIVVVSDHYGRSSLRIQFGHQSPMCRLTTGSARPRNCRCHSGRPVLVRGAVPPFESPPLRHPTDVMLRGPRLSRSEHQGCVLLLQSPSRHGTSVQFCTWLCP